MRYMLVFCVGCLSADAKDPEVVVHGAGVPVIIDVAKDGAPCTHPVPVAYAWDGITYDSFAINPACCPFGYEPVGLDINGSIVCLVQQ